MYLVGGLFLLAGCPSEKVGGVNIFGLTVTLTSRMSSGKGGVNTFGWYVKTTGLMCL